MRVRELIEKLSALPPDAEVRVTHAIDPEKQINSPARDVRFDEMGPLRYVEII